jgi:hypothetical protein
MLWHSLALMLTHWHLTSSLMLQKASLVKRQQRLLCSA